MKFVSSSSAVAAYAVVLGSCFLQAAVSESFVDVDFDVRRIQRDLLQEESNNEEVSDNKEVEPTKIVDIDEPIPISRGPTRFYFENGKLPKFLLTVTEGIEVTVFKHGEVWDRFLLDQEATGGLTGSKLNPDTNVFQVDMDWKKQTFSGQMDPSKTIRGIQIEMEFDLEKNGYKLINLRVVNLALEGKYEDVNLHVTTKHGYSVEAPLGLAFGCMKPGMFGPKVNSSTFSAGLTFPDMALQVYEVRRGRFGPIWECGEIMSIGMWVCLLVSIFLASICLWGFTMLANINTMDRFDDPKGKTIYIPQTD